MISLDGGLPVDAIRGFAENGVEGRAVCACEWIAGIDLPSVRSDNREGARLAIRHLHALGHRRIAHITGPVNNVLIHERREGMTFERQTLGLPSRPDWVIRGDFSLKYGHDAAGRIAAMSDRPTAVFCAPDEVAFGLISGFRTQGIRVPQDISVVGFDDIELSEYFIPGLTTIRQDRRHLGLRAATMLLDRLTGQTGALQPRVETIGVTLVERSGTAPPAQF